MFPFPNATGATNNFTPASISGLTLWLNPKSITGKAHGDNITSWSDSSGNSNTATEATNPPTYHDGRNTFHGQPGVLFSASATRLTVAAAASLNNGQPTYVFFLDARTLESGTADSVWLWNKQNTNPATTACRFNAQQLDFIGRLAAAPGTALEVSLLPDSLPAMTDGIVACILRYDGTAFNFKVAQNGAIDSYGSVTASGAVDTASNGSLTIGRHPTANNTAVLDRIFYDCLVYNRALTDTELQQLAAWGAARYPQTYTKIAGPLFSSAQKNAVGIWVDGTTAYLAYLNSDDKTIGYMTASTSDPHNWSDQGTIFTATNAGRRARVSKYGSTWYLFYDDRVNGGCLLATGSSLASLTNQGVVLAGTGTGLEQYTRHPFVINPNESHDGGWHMLYSGRQGSPTSGVGATFHATSSDGLTWTRDSAHNPILSSTGTASFDGNDAGEPSAYWDGSKYVVFYVGYYLAMNSSTANPWDPHQIGRGTSTNLTSITRDGQGPILQLSQSSSGWDRLAHSSPMPYVIGNTVWLYYCGHKQGSTPGTPEIRAGYGVKN